jgi:hypothetical protein
MSQASGEDSAVYLAQALYTIYQRLFNYMDTKAFVSVYSKKDSTRVQWDSLCCSVSVAKILSKLSGQKSSAGEKNKIKICYFYMGCTTHAFTSRQFCYFSYIRSEHSSFSPPPSSRREGRLSPWAS